LLDSAWLQLPLKDLEDSSGTCSVAEETVPRTMATGATGATEATEAMEEEVDVEEAIVRTTASMDATTSCPGDLVAPHSLRARRRASAERMG